MLRQTKKNIFYAQSGGGTAVINATACGVIQAARQHPEQIGTVFAGQNGIIGALREELIDTAYESDHDIQALMQTPACAFGSCRYKLRDLESHQAEYERLIEVFKAHNIGYFFYNGGGDSQDTTYKISQLAQQQGLELVCLGLPKTIDNDLTHTDNCPGYGSVAKYIAIATQEATLDIRSMCATSSKIFILEVMGRHTGWIAAAAGLIQHDMQPAPHIILMPEVPLQRQNFLDKVDRCVNTDGYCVIVTSEGIRNESGHFISETKTQDAFGHTQLGGAASKLAQCIQNELGLKYHYAIADYLQRSARHIASATDVKQAYTIGETAVKEALAGTDRVMLTIDRLSDSPYKWCIGQVPLADIANVEKKLPSHFIREDGFGITTACRDYIEPLIGGEAYPDYSRGLPQYVTLRKQLAPKKLLAYLK